MTDPDFQRQVQRLHRLTVYGRWLFVAGSWLILGPWSIWSLRSDIELWLEHFTFAAVRYALIYNSLAALCLAFCVGITAAVLVWQSRNLLQGIPPREKRRLEHQAKQICAVGPKHPLWKWICK